MRFSLDFILFVTFLIILRCVTNGARMIKADVNFDENYFVTYSEDHFLKLNQGTEVQLSMDAVSGTGFWSKRVYGSGYFQMKIMLPKSHSPGVVTTFYLMSQRPGDPSGKHSEVDFEFLGSDGPPFTLQTNVFANDDGGREQRVQLWFDPTQDFHQYSILWNQHQIVLFVDEIPIRVFQNLENVGARYPKEVQMSVVGSIWNGEGWASHGAKVDWSKAPFQAHYRMFEINGCVIGSGDCSSQRFWWNGPEYWALNPKQQAAYEIAKRNITYDYCTERGASFKECQVP